MTKSADLGSLKFQLLIDDTEFNNSITKATQAAKDLNVTLSDLLDLRKRYRAEALSAAQAEQDVAKAIGQQNTQMKDNKTTIKGLTNEIKRYNAEKRKMTLLGGVGGGALSQQQGLLNSMVSLAAKYVSLWGAAKLVQSVTRVTAEFELQRTALRSMLGDIQAADALYNKIWDLAVKSPFNAKELVTYAKQLAAYSIPMEQIYDTTKMLADVSAGLGVGMDRLVLAYGQIRSASFLRGQEVRQLTEAGIPILEELRKQFVELGEEAITAGDVFDKISKRLVPFAMVEKVFKNMTSEGGKFFNMQEIQAETLKGKLMILKDAYDKMFNAIGSKNNSSLKGAVDWITNLARNYDKTTGALKVLIATYGAYKVAMMSMTTVYNVQHITSLISHYAKLSARMKALGKDANLLKVTFAKMSTAQIRNAIAGIAGAVALVTSAIIVAVRNSKELERELDALGKNKFNEAKNLAKGFEELADRIKKANEGSQERRDAISEMNRKYGEYLPNLLNEKNALDELAKSEHEVTNAIYGRLQAYAKEEGARKIEEKYGNKIADDTDELIKVLTARGATRDMAIEFVQNYRSALEDAFSKDEILRAAPMMQFEESMKSYFGSNSTVVSEMYKYSGYFETIVSKYQRDFLDMAKANQDFSNQLEARFSVYNYKFADERNAIQGIIDKYGQLENQIRSTGNQTQEETDARLLQNRKDKLDELIDAYRKLNDQYTQLGKNGVFNTQLEKLIKERASLDEKDLTWLQRIVNPLVDDPNRDLKPVDTDQYNEYVDNIRKSYKATMTSYEDLENTYNKLVADKKKNILVDEQALTKAKALYESEKKRKEIIEAIGKALGISVDDKLPKDNSKSKEQIDIETRISTLKDLMGWYDKFKKAGANDKEIQRIFASIFPQEEDVIMANSYRSTLLNLADALDTYDSKAAQALRDDVGVNRFDESLTRFKNAQTAAENLQKTLQKMTEETLLSGTGIEFDVSKVIHDYDQALKKIADDRAEAIKKYFDATGSGNTDVNVEDFFSQLETWDSTSMQNAFAKANDAMDSLANTFIKDWAKVKGIDLSNWGDLSINELRKIVNELNSLLDENGMIKVNDSDLLTKLEAMLKDYPALWATLQDALKTTVDSQKRKAENSLSEEYIKAFKYAAESILELVDALNEYAKVSGNSGLGQSTEALSGIANAAKDVAAGFAAGGWIGAALAIIKDLGTAIIKDMTAAEQLRLALSSAKVDAKISDFDNILSSGDSIFGEDLLSNLLNAQKVIDGVTKSLSALYEELGNQEIRHFDDVLEHITEGNADAYWAAIAKGYKGLETYILKTRDRNGFMNWLGFDDKYNNLKDVIEGLGYEMYDAYGNLNAEALQAILDTYTQLSAEDKNWIESAIKYSKEYEKAILQTESAMKQLIGSVADLATDNIVQGWINAGNAALDYSEILSDVAKSYAKMMVKNQLMSQIFDEKFVAEISKATMDGQTAKAVTMLENKLADIERLAPNIATLLEPLNRWFKTGDESSVGSSIKSVSEDTANLLGAYINGMRADLSAQRIIVEGIGADVKALVAHIPTLDDYLNKIAANTYNTAMSTNSILSNLESMMTAAGGETALRVFMQR